MRAETYHFGASAGVPNNPDLPALVVGGAIDDTDGAEAVALANGWGGTWRWTVFDYHHFHPNAHEALAVVAGRATIAIGGASGRMVEVRAGDYMVLPAGTGHKRVSSEGGFQVMGAYPDGQHDVETCRDGGPLAGMADRIAQVPRPRRDPFLGDSGPLVSAWDL